MSSSNTTRSVPTKLMVLIIKSCVYMKRFYSLIIIVFRSRQSIKVSSSNAGSLLINIL